MKLKLVLAALLLSLVPLDGSFGQSSAISLIYRLGRAMTGSEGAAAAAPGLVAPATRSLPFAAGALGSAIPLTPGYGEPSTSIEALLAASGVPHVQTGVMLRLLEASERAGVGFKLAPAELEALPGPPVRARPSAAVGERPRAPGAPEDADRLPKLEDAGRE